MWSQDTGSRAKITSVNNRWSLVEFGNGVCPAGADLSWPGLDIIIMEIGLGVLWSFGEFSGASEVVEKISPLCLR